MAIASATMALQAFCGDDCRMVATGRDTYPIARVELWVLVDVGAAPYPELPERVERPPECPVEGATVVEWLRLGSFVCCWGEPAAPVRNQLSAGIALWWSHCVRCRAYHRAPVAAWCGRGTVARWGGGVKALLKVRLRRILGSNAARFAVKNGA